MRKRAFALGCFGSRLALWTAAALALLAPGSAGNPEPSIHFVTTAVPGAATGGLYNVVIEMGTTEGAPKPDAFLVTAGVLPPGVVLSADRTDGDGNGVPDPGGLLTGDARLLGFPRATGTFNFTLRATVTGASPPLEATQAFTIVVTEGPIAILTPTAEEGFRDFVVAPFPAELPLANPANPASFQSVVIDVAGGSSDRWMVIYVPREAELSTFDTLASGPSDDTDESPNSGSLFWPDFNDGGLVNLQAGTTKIQLAGYFSPRGPTGTISPLRPDWFQRTAAAGGPPTVPVADLIPGRTILFSDYYDPQYETTFVRSSDLPDWRKYPFSADQYTVAFQPDGDPTALVFPIIVEAIDRRFTLDKSDDVIARKAYLLRAETPHPPTFTAPTQPPCDTTFDWAAGKKLAFAVAASDTNTGDTVTLTVTGLPAGATLTPALPLTANPAQTAFSWTPAAADEGPHVVVFTATDGTGRQATCTLTVDVRLDSDGDGLPDAWELDGYTLLDDGTVVAGNQGARFVNLPDMGAVVGTKDVFVEIDSIAGITPPEQAGLDQVVAAFAAAPPAGIALHCRVDDVVVFDSRYDLDGNGVLGTGDVDTYDWTELDAIKADHFPEELGHAVHYCVFSGPTSAANSGISRGIDASDFIVSLGGFPMGGTVWQHAGTFMHELGHNLGLGHGGADDKNRKPNYLSVMNKPFQLQGLRTIDGNGEVQDGRFDYSRQRIDLDENAVNESLGLGAGAPPSYATMWFRYDVQHWTTDEGASDGPVTGGIDWNNDGFVLTVAVPIDVTDDGAKTVLQGHDDWANLSFTGARIGGGAALPLPQVTGVGEELTLPEAQQLGIAPPTKLHGHVADGQKIVLTWKPVGPKEEASYRVYRGIADGAPVPIGTAEESNFEDADVVSGVTYTYLVRVVNALGVESTQAATVHVTFGE